MDKEILLTADLIRHRNGLRFLFPGKWPETIAPYRKILCDLTAKSGKPLADVALAAAKKLDEAGHDPSMLVAAFVEECESQEAACRT
jgi:hypothetical protein